MGHCQKGGLERMGELRGLTGINLQSYISNLGCVTYRARNMVSNTAMTLYVNGWLIESVLIS